MPWQTPDTFATGETPNAAKLDILSYLAGYLKGQDGPIGVSAPQTRTQALNAPLLAHGSAFATYWYGSGIAGSAVNVVVNGDSDILAACSVMPFIYNETTPAWVTGTIRAFTVGAPGTQTIYTDGGANVVQMTNAANGSLTIQRSAGTRTYAAFLWLFWR